MTGYGRSEIQNNGWSQVWEIRSVNHRHLDCRWRLPSIARPLEQDFERLLREGACRGRVDVFLHLAVHRKDLMGSELNVPMAEAMLEQIGRLAAKRGDPLEPDYLRLLQIPYLWEEHAGEPDPELTESLLQGLGEALDSWNRAREREGAMLVDDITARLERMGEWLALLRQRAPQVSKEKSEALEGRIRNLMEDHSLQPEESRLMQELAVLADRIDVSEELVRLAAHLEQLANILGKEGGIGKRLDFLLQECFREINTCGNKAQDTQVSRLVVDFKAELEKCREQVQNIE
jgi:uncharacterized protein (TIGR00255 family)